MRFALRIPLLASVTLACACRPQGRPYAYFENGGVAPVAATCAETGGSGGRGVAAFVDAVANCAEDRDWRIPVGATFAFWKIQTSARYAGPAIAPSVRVALLRVDPSSGEEAVGLVSGDGAIATTTGGGQSGAQPTSGDGAARLVSGDGAAGLAAGSGSATETTPSTTAGSGSASLASGGGAAQVLEVRKSAEAAEVEVGRASSFTVEVENVGAVPLVDVFVFDHVAPAVRLTSTDGARSVRTAEGTLLLWRIESGLQPGERRSFRVRYEVPRVETAR